MVYRKISLIFRVIFAVCLLTIAAQAQLIGADDSGKFGANASLSESSFKVSDNSAAQDSDSSAMTRASLLLGGKLGPKFDVDAGFNYGTGPNVSMLQLEQHFWFKASPHFNAGFGGTFFNVNLANDPYGFQKLLGVQLAFAYHSPRLILAYKGGPVMNTSTTNPSNLAHVLTLSYVVDKSPKRPLSIFIQALFIRFMAPDGVLSQLSDISLGLNFGFF